MAKQPKTKTRRRFRLIPLTVTMLSLLLVIKVNDLYLNSRQLRELYGVRDASAEDKAAEAGHGSEAKTGDAKPEAETAVKEGEIKESDAHGEAAKTEEGGHGGGHGESAKPPEEPRTFGTGKSTIKQIEAFRQKESGPTYSQTELDLLQNLSKRRDELDQRERDLDVKSKVLEASEKRLDDKVIEIRRLQIQLNKIVAKYDEKQSTEIKSLVKIYENMKPGDAANIFNQMDLPILLEVIDKMSERKVAPVLAAMDPKKAKDVTQELAEMRRSITAAGAGGAAPAAAAP